jgi:hypothetical protein
MASHGIVNTNACISCDALPENMEVSASQCEIFSSDVYQTENEISEEVRALIASWENSHRTRDNEPCHLFGQLSAMQPASSTPVLVDDMPPPQRYRRVSKKAFMG